MKIRNFALLCLPFLFLNACTPVGMLVSAGTTAGTFAMEERGLEGAANDIAIKADLLSKWSGAELSYISDLSSIVYMGNALIMGSVETEEERSRAIELAWQTEGIKNVYNEILLKKDSTIEDFAHDQWISAKLFTALTFDSDVLDINYKYDVEGGIVYFIGLAQSKGELNRVIAHAKNISYVRKVVTHVEIKERKSMYKAQGSSTVSAQ